jgi:hypothetical protein
MPETNSLKDYAREYIRLSLLGVNNINTLKECSKALPPATKLYTAPDEKKVDKWLNTSGSTSDAAKKVAAAVNDGDNINDVPVETSANGTLA